MGYMIFSDKKIRIKLWPHVTFCSKIKKSTSICFCVGFKETRDLDFFVPFFFVFFLFSSFFCGRRSFSIRPKETDSGDHKRLQCDS